ncbi:hypothetical protein EKK58_03285 [Candidatus Dependentiae bacterium]|nr:MAG: hypothetical protein EKK58_03285 [Candidatus Dependentiae bacterium]
MNELIDTCFKLLNMLILSVIFLYVFYQYILPILKTEMLNDQANVNAFENKKLLLAQEVESVQKSLVQEASDQKILKQKLLFWNSSIDQLRISKNLAKQELTDQIYNRKCLMQKKQVFILNQKNTLAKTFTKAEKELESFFNNEENGKEHIEKLIAHYCSKEGI